MVCHIRSISQKAASIHEKLVSVHNRNPIPRSQFDELFLMRCKEHIGQLKDGACSSYFCECTFEIAGVADRHDLQLEPESLCGNLRLPKIFGVSRV